MMDPQQGLDSRQTPFTQPSGRWRCSACSMELESSVLTCPKDGTRALPPPQQDPQFADYEFIATIGSGGMGVIYKARHIALDKLVAIKMLHPYLLSPEAIRRFQIEGQAVNKLHHPFVIKVHDLGVCQSGPFMIMDYVDGRNLTQLLQEEQPLDLRRVLSIFIQACDALSHAHSRGVLHRDLKPSNIMLRRNYRNEEEVCIMDFGIAKLTDDQASGGNLTRTGEAIGSPVYMSPEQSRGSNAVDARSDLYSLGCVMFESLTGAPPFQGNTPLETMMMHLNDKPMSLSQSVLGSRRFDPGIEKVIERSLEKDPDRRYQTMDELKQHLSAIRDGEKIEQLSHPKPAAKRPTTAVVLCGAIVIAALSAFAIFLGEFGKSTDKDAGTTKTNSGANGAAAGDPQALLNAALPNPSVRQMLINSITDGDTTIHPPSQMEPATDQDVVELKLAQKAESINLSYSHVSSAGLKNMIGLPKLTAIDVSWCPNIDRLTPFRHMPNLKILNLTHDAIDDRQLLEISGMHLERLYLSETEVKNLDALRGMTSLTCLEAARTPLTDKAIENISTLSNLSDLDLSNTPISNSALGHLAKLHKLLHLHLENCEHLTDDSIQRLKKQLPDDCELKSTHSKPGTTSLPTEQTEREDLDKARVLMQNQHFDKAEAVLSRLLTRLHEQQPPHYLLFERTKMLLAQAKLKLHQPGAALKLIDDTIELVEHGPAKSDVPLLPAMYAFKAEVCMALKRNNEALSAFANCAQLYKNSAQELFSQHEWRDRQLKRGLTLEAMADIQINATPRDLLSGEQKLSEAIEILNPYDSQMARLAMLKLGRAYWYDASATKNDAQKRSKLLQARAQLSAVYSLNRSDLDLDSMVRYKILLADTEFQLGHYDAAESMTKALLQQHANLASDVRASELSLLVQICMKTGRPEEARAYQKQWDSLKK